MNCDYSRVAPTVTVGTGACQTCRGPPGPTHPPPGVDVGNVHEGVVFLQGLVLVQNLHLEEQEGQNTMTLAIWPTGSKLGVSGGRKVDLQAVPGYSGVSR